MLPQTVTEIRFINRGMNHTPKWFVQRTYVDKGGEGHVDLFKLDPESAAILEYVYLDNMGIPIPKREVVED